MTQSEKFLFETEFERPGAALLEKQEDPDTVLLYTEPDITAARREAHEQGHAAGLDEARTETSATVASALQVLGAQVEGLLGDVDARIEEVRKDAAGLAFAIGRTLAATLLEREPVLEIEAVIRECLNTLDSQGSSERLVLRVAPEIADDVRSLAGQLVQEVGFAGAIAVMDDQSMNGANCSVGWSSGGAIRNQKAVEEMIGAAVRRYTESGQVCVPVDPQPAIAEAQVETHPEVDLYASSKAVRIEAQDPPAETVPPIAAPELSAEPSVVTTADSGETDDPAAATPPNAEGPRGPSDQ